MFMEVRGRLSASKRKTCLTTFREFRYQNCLGHAGLQTDQLSHNWAVRSRWSNWSNRLYFVKEWCSETAQDHLTVRDLVKEWGSETAQDHLTVRDLVKEWGSWIAQGHLAGRERQLNSQGHLTGRQRKLNCTRSCDRTGLGGGRLAVMHWSSQHCGRILMIPVWGVVWRGEQRQRPSPWFVKTVALVCKRPWPWFVKDRYLGL